MDAREQIDALLQTGSEKLNQIDNLSLEHQELTFQPETEMNKTRKAAILREISSIQSEIMDINDQLIELKSEISEAKFHKEIGQFIHRCCAV